MALRLLPAIINDNDEDDDGNFTNWMSSYWGHGAQNKHPKERKHSFRRPPKSKADRRSSLPCMSQLDAMQMTRLQSASVGPIHKPREDKELRVHPRAQRTFSDENSRQKTSLPESRITTIPELAESFERRLRFHHKKVTSLSDADNLCLVCHGDMRKEGGEAVHELYCAHCFHKECMEQWRWKKQTCPMCGSHVLMPEPLYWSCVLVKMP